MNRMPRRLHKTVLDYMVIAISPALIMLLIGSFVFFMLEVFYQGPFLLRLRFIFGLFVLGTVCIGRIAIEEGRGYAAMFAAPLAIVSLLAIFKFVEVRGEMQAFGPLVNIGLLALIWWSAHQLTWDCTLIDDQQDASGEGLLHHMGLESSTEEAAGRAGTAGPPDRPTEPKTTWSEWFSNRRKRRHTPGSWVLYISLIALPLFGFFNRFIPAAAESRRFAFQMLVIYVASALGLLLTTSFLGLRRYLRQRRLEMPADMAAMWLVIGGVMIVVLLAFCMLLPRPGAEYAISQAPTAWLSSEDLRPSRWGFGNDGPEDKKGKGADRGSAKSQSDRPSQQDQQSEPSQKSQQGQKSNQSPKSQQQSDQSQQSQQQQSQQQPPQSQQQPPQSQQQPPQSQQQPPQSQQQSQQSQQPRQSDPSQPQPSQRSSPSFNPSRALEAVAGALQGLLKLFFYAILVGLAVFAAWHYRRDIHAAWQKFLAELRALWERLFGGKMAAVEETSASATEPKHVLRPFASYADPFQSDTVSRFSPEQLVQYTFEAFEAWAREQGMPRHPKATPLEFSADVARKSPVGEEARRAAELYCRVAYARRKIAPAQAQQLKALWRLMAEKPGTPTHAV